MPGMRDVARVAQVSLSTVSAVLSDSDKYVSEEIRERVTKAAAEIGYQMPERKKKQDKDRGSASGLRSDHSSP